MELAGRKKFASTLDREKSLLLKFCVFATGLSGIVTEYVLSTLASYLIGNSVLQWTIVISLMLFAMGVGSRLSKYITNHLLEFFILTEFVISFLCAVSAGASFLSSIYTVHVGFIIYTFSFTIGLLIGFEIPLITRINSYYEELRTNIASVLEKDYFGALAGGVLFAFFALPHLGLTYTPIALGTINFTVASVLLFRLRRSIPYVRLLYPNFAFVLVSIILLFIYIKPIILYGEQKKYKDTIIFEKQTKYQKIVLTRWKDDIWLYINGNEQFSSFDEEKYHEPLVHPAMSLLGQRNNILVLGGGDGLALREILKYNDVKKVVLVDIDPQMTALAGEHPALTGLNGDSLNNPKVEVIHMDAFKYLSKVKDYYNVIFADLPDPNNMELNLLYSLEFYKLALRQLSRGGVFVTQATSPVYSKKAFLSIMKTMQEAGFTVLPYRNSIPTMGETGWMLGVKPGHITEEGLKSIMEGMAFDTVETRFLNREAMISMVNFGKNVFEEIDRIEINSRINPVLFGYYREGMWDFY